MKILFIYPDLISPDPSWSGHYYLGLAVLSACLREAGHETDLLHVHHPLKHEEMLRWVEENRAGDDTLLAFSATTNQFRHVEEWAPLLKRATGLPTIAGGMHPTLSPAGAIAAEGIDMICQGEGERPLVAVADRLETGRDVRGIEGIWFKSGRGEVVDQGLAPLTDVDRLPLPHWEVYRNYRSLMYIRDGIGLFMASRGCAYRCAYCCNGALLDLHRGSGSYLRLMSVPRVIEELKTFMTRYPECRALFFEDDVFGIDKSWLGEFVDAYRRDIDKPFGCNLRPNLVDDDLVEMLAGAGCGRVQMAIESGNDCIRNEVLERRLSREQLVSSFRSLTRAGIKVLAYNIIGSPHETPEAVLDTIKLNATIDPDFIQHSLFHPYEGTPLHELVTREDLWAKERGVEDYFEDTALDQDSISREQVLMFHRCFQPLVRHYRRLGKLPPWLGAPTTALTDRFLKWRGAPGVMRRLSSQAPVAPAAERATE